MEYDNGSGGDWGGKISYRYAFDAPTPSGSSGTAESFDPRAHFFDPVRREYAQRIKVHDPSNANLPEGINPEGRVTVHLYGSGAFVEYSTVAIALSGTMTVASYPVTAVATVRSESDSTLSVHFESRGVSWATHLEAEATVVFEGGREFEVVRGDFGLVRTNGGIGLLLRTPSVTVNILGPADDVYIEYPAISNPNPNNVDIDLDIGRGNVSVDVAGALTSHIYELIVHATEVTAEIVSEGGKIRVPPAARTVSVSVPAVVGETVSYTLSVANGERFSHRYNGNIEYPPGWTVSPEGVVGSPTITGVTVITVTASSGKISFVRSPEDVLQRILETWVITFDTREPAPPVPPAPPDSSGMVSVHLHGSNATIAYSATAITLSEGAMTVASYPVTAVARFTSAESDLSLHFRSSTGVAWTVILYSQETEFSSSEPGFIAATLTSGLDVVFEGGSALSVREGGILLDDRSGSINSLNSPFVRAHLSGPAKVGMEYPTFDSLPPYPQTMVADLSILEGVASVDVAGALASRLELDVEAAAATAEIFSDEGGGRVKLTVPPVYRTVTVSVSAVVGGDGFVHFARREWGAVQPSLQRLCQLSFRLDGESGGSGRFANDNGGYSRHGDRLQRIHRLLPRFG